MHSRDFLHFFFLAVNTICKLYVSVPLFGRPLAPLGMSSSHNKQVVVCSNKFLLKDLGQVIFNNLWTSVFLSGKEKY